MRNIGRALVKRWPLLLACGMCVALAVPTINDYIDDPNLITYFSADEGGQMDLAWWFYSGERRDSLQWEAEYGLEVLYMADLARLVLSRFMDITPGTFVLMARWFHLLGWLGALCALWRLVGRHVRPGWPQTVAVLLLTVRPAFAYLCNNWKPDPVVLLCLIVALDYLLRNVSTPKWRYIVYALACAAVAFILKYAGIFILPAAVASMCVASRQRSPFPTFRFAWMLYLCVGAGLLALMLSAIYSYVRLSTGMTWYQSHGVLGSLHANPAMWWMGVVSVSLIGFSMALWLCMRVRQPAMRRVLERFNAINSYGLIAAGIFGACVALFGFRWLVAPQHFIASFSQLLPRAGSTASLQQLSSIGFGPAFTSNLVTSVRLFDPWLVLLLVGYLATEYAQRARLSAAGLIDRHKRYVLLAFLVPFFLVMASMVRVAQHHMLPFVAAVCILILYGMDMFRAAATHRRWLVAGLCGVTAILCIDVGSNGLAVVRERMHDYHQRQDVIFDVATWWERNIPAHAKVVSDHYTRVYVPPAHRDVRVFRGYQQMRDLIAAYDPAYVYYNTGPSGGTPLPPLETIVPDAQLELVKAFETRQGAFERIEGDRFVFYRVRQRGKEAP